MTALNKSDRSGVNPRVAAPDVHTVMPGVQSEVNPRHRWQAAYVRRLAVSDVAMIVAAGPSRSMVPFRCRPRRCEHQRPRTLQLHRRLTRIDRRVDCNAQHFPD